MSYLKQSLRVVLLIALAVASMPYAQATTQVSNPILFVTQVPISADFTTITAVFGNHKAGMQDVGRGGDLWIRYADGTSRNLTAVAGLGGSGMLTGTKAIAVRDPAVHWDGTKAVFSMVVGAPTQRYQLTTHYWQLYEVTGFLNPIGPITITKVLNQPANFNNISPMYGTDDRIIFTSDRPRNGAAHLYPQLDEYELAPVVSGLWSLDPTTGDLFMLDHAPSGDFTPIIDSYGRVIFTRWDHMQRDQQADGETPGGCYSATYGTFNYSDETATATYSTTNPIRTEVWPEPRACRTDLLTGTGLYGHSFNHFFPWQANEDGTELETLNHIGRHELHGYIAGSRTDDSNIVEYYGQYARYNSNSINNMLQIKEDPLNPGRYYGIDAPEFGTHAAGQVISLTATLTQSADYIAVSYVTHRATASTCDTNCTNHSGLYREPLPMLDGSIVVVHTAETQQDQNVGTTANPQSLYDFRLKTIALSGAYWTPNMTLTAGITKNISYWDPDTLVTYAGVLWELNPVEVRARPRPIRLTPTLPAPEQQLFNSKSVNVAAFQTYLRNNNLALVVSRDVTTRDDADKQQPFNLRVISGTAQTTGAAGKIYDLKYIQFFQADQLRGWTGCCSTTPRPGRRVLGQAMHDAAAIGNNPPTTGPQGSTILGADGSQANIVPARRAMAWQLTDANGVGVVRERYWLTFQPGEMRVCTSCHGLNDQNQAGQTKPTNPPQALGTLLDYWKVLQNLTPRVYLPLVVR